MIIIIIAAVGALLSPFIITLVYGSRYADAVALSTVFWIVNAINAAFRMIPMNFLPAIGVAKFNAIMAAVSCGVHLVVSYLAIDSFGILGAGIATGVVYIVSGLAYWIYFRKKCLEE